MLQIMLKYKSMLKLIKPKFFYQKQVGVAQQDNEYLFQFLLSQQQPATKRRQSEPTWRSYPFDMDSYPKLLNFNVSKVPSTTCIYITNAQFNCFLSILLNSFFLSIFYVGEVIKLTSMFWVLYVSVHVFSVILSGISIKHFRT